MLKGFTFENNPRRPTPKRLLVALPARFGGDRTVIKVILFKMETNLVDPND
ncbi:hypothetical protein [Levilactobacillus fujinensis]|uniref:hypothetical protein n=1 Tax=Levilactobacillus fujinensis TaxID=2486024 RepID=UPI0036D31EFA